MTRRVRLYADFIASIENEIALESLVFELLGVSPEDVGYLPRPAKWVVYSRRCRRLFRYLIWLANLFWIFGGSCAFFFFQFFPIWLRSERVAPIAAEFMTQPGYVLALSSRVGEIVNLKHFENLPCAWISMPWAPLARIPADAKCIDIFSFLNKSDIWYAFRDAIAVTYFLHKRKRTSLWTLQSYTAFRWFAVRTALDKLSGRFIMTEHFDRWAVLVDSSVLAQKFKTNTAGEIRRRDLVLVQHGSLGNLGESNGQASTLILRRKLRAVTELYAYNIDAENIFKKDVLSSGCVRRGVTVSYYQPSIELRIDPEYKGLKILFVGHSLCEELHQHILYSIASHFEFQAYYKPHPLAHMSEQMNGQDWKIINDVKYFPAVDLLISYPSTLVQEYSGWGTPAMVHGIDLAKNSSSDFIDSIIVKLGDIMKNSEANTTTFRNYNNGY